MSAALHSSAEVEKLARCLATDAERLRALEASVESSLRLAPRPLKPLLRKVLTG